MAPSAGGALDVSTPLEQRAGAAVSSLMDEIFGNALTIWLAGIGAAVLAALAVRFTDRAVKRRLGHGRQNGAAAWALLTGVLQGTSWLLALAAALFVFAQIVALPAQQSSTMKASRSRMASKSAA